MKYTIILCVLAISTLFSCSSSKETVDSSNETMTRGEGDQRKKGKKDIAKMFEEMDANDDGRLAKLEVKGRLADNFDQIDVDGDGYITMEEMKNSKPKRGDRGPKRN